MPIKTGPAGGLFFKRNDLVNHPRTQGKFFQKKRKKVLTLSGVCIPFPIPAATSVTRSGMFFASLPRVHEQVRGGADDPMSASATNRKQQGSTHPFRSHWLRSLTAQVRFRTSNGNRMDHIQKQQELNCAFFVDFLNRSLIQIVPWSPRWLRKR